jgi:hypothetical protein
MSVRWRRKDWQLKFLPHNNGRAPNPRAVARMNEMARKLERSDILFEFLAIMRSAPILPLPLRPLQPISLQKAVCGRALNQFRSSGSLARYTLPAGVEPATLSRIWRTPAIIASAVPRAL